MCTIRSLREAVFPIHIKIGDYRMANPFITNGFRGERDLPMQLSERIPPAESLRIPA
jgi:hypothetical protein